MKNNLVLRNRRIINRLRFDRPVIEQHKERIIPKDNISNGVLCTIVGVALLAVMWMAGNI